MIYLIRGRFDFKNEMFWTWGITGSLAKVLTVVHEIFFKNYVVNPDHQKVYGLQHTKIGKIWVFLLWVTFDVQNRKFWPRGLSRSIAKVLTDVHEKFWQKLCRNSRSPKCPWTIAHENRQNYGFSCPGHIWLLKWDVLAVKANWFDSKGLNERPRKILAKIMSESRSPKSPWTIAHENR